VDDITTQVSYSLEALTSEFNIIAHNLANVSTAGYKRRCSGFAEAIGRQTVETATETGETELSPMIFDLSQGNLVQTGRTLDFALLGKGFFVIETPEGPLYTRHGIFQINHIGQLVDSEGRVVAGTAGPIIVPTDTSPSRMHATSEGRIGVGSTVFGQFRIVDFPDHENDLVPAGAGCFAGPAEVEPVIADDAIVKQGYQEASNVQLVNELVNMIMVSRLYEANVKVVESKSDATSSLLSVGTA
jgi:flagellar basal body rod protein FlgG